MTVLMGYLQQLHHIRVLVKHLLELVKDDIVAVGAARVRAHSTKGKVETLVAGVPLDGDRAALGNAVTQHQLTVVIQPHL